MVKGSHVYILASTDHLSSCLIKISHKLKSEYINMNSMFVIESITLELDLGDQVLCLTHS